MSNILDVEFSDLNMQKTVHLLTKCIKENKKDCKHIVTANPEIVLLANKSESLKKSIQDSFMVTADGIGIILASKITNQKIDGRVTGFDLISNIFSSFEEKKDHLNVFLLGASEENVKLAKENLSKSYNFVNVKGAAHGFFDEKDIPAIIDDINRNEIDLLLVGLGCPKQELFISTYKHELSVNVAIGCGGSIDVFSGNVKRAPKVFQKFGMEWFYRLVKQPSRIKRQIILPLFLVDVLRNK